MPVKPEELAAANAYLERSGMARYGWLPHGLRVAFHKAGIQPAQLRELGSHFVKIREPTEVAEVIKVAQGKLATSPQAAFKHLVKQSVEIVQYSFEPICTSRTYSGFVKLLARFIVVRGNGRF